MAKRHLKARARQTNRTATIATQKKGKGRKQAAQALPTVTLPIAVLPFVALRDQGRPHYWNVPPVAETLKAHCDAERLGRQYAMQYAEWLRSYPELVGMGSLGWIASDIDFRDPTRAGYWIGFFACIEGALFDAM